jgi:hypothetical protein
MRAARDMVLSPKAIEFPCGVPQRNNAVEQCYLTTAANFSSRRFA